MRTHVSKVLAGTGSAWKDIFTLAEGEIVAFQWSDKQAIAGLVPEIGFARGTKNPETPIVVGPIPANNAACLRKDYQAIDKETQILTVVELPKDEVSPIFKVIYHSEFDVAPNRIAQIVVSVKKTADITSTDDYAAAIKDAFDAQDEYKGAKYFDVTVSGSALTFIPFTQRTAEEPYNGIDRPETMYIEVGAPNRFVDEGEYTVEPGSESAGAGGTPKHPHGTPIQIMWLEDKHMGRFGFSDRVSWNDQKKYIYQAVYGEEYDTLVISGDSPREGHMQNLHQNPVGIILACSGGTLDTLQADVEKAVTVHDVTES